MTAVAEGLSRATKDAVRERFVTKDPGLQRIEQSDLGHFGEHDLGKTCSPTAQLFRNDCSGRRIKNDLSSAWAVAEVEHVVQRAGNRVR